MDINSLKSKNPFPLVYIILLNYNGYKDTIECINSLEKISYKNYKIVIVDNASTDGSEDILKNEFPHHIFIQTGSNLGFAGGNNVGIKYALENGADYILLLNNDTVVEPNFLEPLVEYADKDNKVGIVGGKINYYHNRNKIWSAGGKVNLFTGSTYHFGLNKNNSDYINKFNKVKFLTGCVQLIKKDLINDIGFLDEDYFLYYEDTDYCTRAVKNGWKLVYIPNSIIYHKVSSSTKKSSPIQLYYLTRNRMLFISKNSNNKLAKIIFNCYWIIVSILRYIRKFFLKDKNRVYIYLGIKDYYLKNFGYRKIK